MLKKVVIFFQANFLVAILSLIITLLTAKYLGASGRGSLSIVLVYVALAQLINEIFGVGSAFFLLKKYRIQEIFAVSYTWFVVTSIVTAILLSVFNLVDNNIRVVFFLNVFLASVSLLNLRVLLNKSGVQWYNFLIILQPTIILISIVIVGSLSIQRFLVYQTLASAVTTTISLLCLLSEIKSQSFRLNMIKPLIKESLRLGIVNQAANLSQLINYRVSYFFIEKFQGIKEVGIFSIVLSFANVIWLFAVSTGTLLGNDISKKEQLSKVDFVRFGNYIKIAIFVTFISLIVVYLTPASLYSRILNKDFVDVKVLLLLMGPAILIFTAAKILGHFFSSLGKMSVNFYSSLAGLIPSVVFGYIFIKKYQMTGAVVSCSLSFIISSLILIFFFRRERRKTNILPE